MADGEVEGGGDPAASAGALDGERPKLGGSPEGCGRFRGKVMGSRGGAGPTFRERGDGFSGTVVLEVPRSVMAQ